MTKPMFYVSAAIVACLAIATTASAKKLNPAKTPSPRHEARLGKGSVMLEIAGPTDAQTAEAFQKALAANGLQATVHENKKGGKPLHLMAQIDKTTDLSPWSKAVMSAIQTKKGQSPPALELVIYAPLTKENAPQVTAQLEKVKGVDAKHSTADIKKGSLRVRFTGTDKVTPEDVSNAIQAAGVTGTFAKTAKTGKTKKTS